MKMDFGRYLLLRCLDPFVILGSSVGQTTKG